MNGRRLNVDIAIVGLSCRFPGAVTAEEYWKNLCDGVESIVFFSDQELVAAGVAPSLLANPSYVKAAPMLRDVEMFDASFFGYSPKDATLMDPQQRLFLEVCWEAFENAGYDPAAYPGKVGVLSAGGGVVTSYLLAKLHHAELPGQTASIAHINNDKDFLSTRVSFKLNLTGPSFTIQSACSSSLVAIHQACQNLRFNECDMMLVGGSVVRVPQAQGYLAEKRNLHSLDGHCRPFDAVGQGTIFGSGVGAVLLKPLEDAVADRDHIFAVIKGTAANNDGSNKSSYTAPSLGQQSQAVVDALELAGVNANSVGYVECHSTGTIVGDPLEIEALTKAFRKQSDRKQYCAVGSVKANIGHPEQAAGIAGLIKIALVLHHKRIPPSINYETTNPAIDFASSPFYVNTRLQDFPLTDGPRRAGLNSLGIGGTNTFAVLEEAPPTPAMDLQSPAPSPCVVTLSAKSREALVARVVQLLNWLDDNPSAPLGDLCFTTNVSRSQFPFRFAAPAASVTELKSQLAAWLRRMTEDVSSLQRNSHAPIAFMFSGQGSQHPGMAAELYRTHSVFRDAIDRCHALAEPHLEHGLREVIFAGDGDDALVHRTDYTQPALFAVEYALAELLKSWGVVPDAVIGHSLGEIAAACAADVLALEDAMRLVTARGALMHRLPGGGAMTSIMAEESAVRPLIERIAPEITVAAMNGPLNTVVSGDRDALKMLSEELDRQSITYRELRISNGFHSPRTEPILDDLERVAGEIKHNAPKLPLISNLTGEVMSAAPNKAYWRRHLREAVRFGDGMDALAGLELRTFLEIGPHPVLLPLAQVCLGGKGKSAVWIATLNRQKSDAASISEMLAALYLAGHNIDWIAVHADSSWRRIPLPTYPFQRKRYWLEDDTIHASAGKTAVEQVHPLVGKRINSAAKEVRYEARYSVRHAGYLSDHRVRGTVVLPTTAELEAAMVVGRMHFGTPLVSFDDAMHHEAMSFANGEDRIVQLVVTPLQSGRASFSLASAATEDPEVRHTHMTGTLRKSEGPSGSTFSTKQVRDRCQQTLPAADFYVRLAKLGLEYGPSFRGIRELYLGEREALAKVRLPEGLATAEYLMHPAFLDACLHTYPLVLDGAGSAKSNGGSSYLPVSLAGFRCYQDGVDQAWVHTTLRSVEEDDTQVVDIRVYDAAERPVAELEGLAVRLLPLEKVNQSRAGADDLFYQVAWRRRVRAAANPGQDRAPASWIIFADTKGVGGALAGRLEAAGHHCHLVYRNDTFAKRGARTWTVNERQPRDFPRLLEQFASSETQPCDGVVYLWGLDAPSIEGLALPQLKSASEMMCRGALAILHALAETRSTNPTGRRVWFVTAKTQRTNGRNQHVDPIQACLWGLGRTAAIEYPGIWGGLIDLQFDGDPARDIDLLAAELLRPDGETQIAICAAGERHVPRFVKQSLTELPAQLPPVRGDASYLVTGGLGMLGRNVAKWLISNGAKHLVLTGRNASSAAARDLFGAAEINGAAIHVVAADISRDEDVSRLMQTIGNELPPLKGVVQSAGVLDDGILAQLEWDRFVHLFEPRIYGSWLLHEYTKSLELDFFILKSSLLSLLGSAGQANYTASSAFLDSLGAYRRAVGLPATVINWCAWSGGGLATVSGARGEAMWSSLGVEFLSPDRAMPAFDKLMHRDVDQIAVAVADWPTYAGRVGEPPLLAELLNRNQVSDLPKPVQENVVLAASSTAANGQGRQQLLGRVRDHITAKLGFTEVIDLDQPLNELGLDSLMSVALSNSLEQEFGTPVSVRELIKGPTINQLVDGVFRELVGRFSPKGNDAPEATPVAAPIVPARAPVVRSPVVSEQAWSKLRTDQIAAGAVKIAGDQIQGGLKLQRVTNGRGRIETVMEAAGRGNGSENSRDVRRDGDISPAVNGNGADTDHFSTPVPRAAAAARLRTVGKWLIAPRPNPQARARLFCFPYAGGGVVSFRTWPHLLDDAVEVVAIEPPGRGTRINEKAIDNLDAFVAGLLSEMVDWLDRPSAFFGHCLGGLTMFATLCALPEKCARFVKYSFPCAVRPPHLLARRGNFEDNLIYDMLLHRGFDLGVPPLAQTDEVFADIIRQFDTPAADRMLESPKLRKALLPTVRAEFGMAYNYKHRPVERFSFPICSFVGDLDPWVTEQDSAGWGDLTRGGFTNHLRKGSHFLLVDDREFILDTINSEFVRRVI
jgi:acyl transferase domain-containing protein/surfactin synthase thioesterase subunit/acyl carrier protein